MKPPDANEETLFDAARQMPDLQARTAYLDAACAGNPNLRQRIEDLLKAGFQADQFLAGDPLELGAAGRQTILVGPLSEGPGTVIGNYKLLEKLGEGGFGVVYMAEQKQPVKRRVALKIIKVGMDTREVVARFEAERQALAILDHPNIAKVFDAGATETTLGSPLPSDGRGIKGEGHSPLCTPHSALPSGRPYFVMELVRGIKITDYCDQTNLSTRERLDLFMQVCHAVQHAHQKGIIHRDLKPSNILVTVNDGVAVPKIIDFGIAKATQMELTEKTVFTRFQQFLGTPAYMSPEQAEITSVDVDTRSDIYSLGVLLYELLTGKTPFDAKELLQAGLDEMRRTLREKEPERPSTRLTQELVAADISPRRSSPGLAIPTQDEISADSRRRLRLKEQIARLRGDLDWIVMKCLEKDRARRYETANGLASDIQRHLSNEPVVACPPSNLYRFQKLVRRNKLMFVAGSAMAAALVVGLCIATWGLVRERHARARAVAAEAEQRRFRRQAETEAAKSQQVAQFLKDMLQGAGPEVAEGRDATILVQILDKTADRIGKELTNQPAVEADLRDTIGQLYWDLGKWAKAEQVLQRAVAINRELHPEGDPTLSSTLNHLGEAVYSQGRFVEAETVFRETLAMARKLYGNEHRDVGTALHNLATALNSEGKLSEAKLAAEESLHLKRKVPGKEDRDLAETLGQLAEISRNQGSFAESETYFRQALAIIRKNSTNEDRHLEIALNNLALALKDERKFAEAESLSREALAMDRRLLGNEHPEVVANLNNLASVIAGEGKLEEAEAVGREALEIAKKLPPGSQVGLAQTLHKLSDTLRMEGKFVEAEAAARVALATARKQLGEGSPAVGAIVRNLANVLLGQHRYDDAEKLYNEFLSSPAVSQTAGAWVLAGRGDFFARRTRWAEAAADLTRVLEVRSDDPVVSHWLASVLVERGDLQAYQERCRKSIVRFANASAPLAASCIASDCLILPSSGADLEVVGRLADVALSAGTNHPDWATYVITKALAEYRLGHFESALDRASKALANLLSNSHVDTCRRVQAHLVSAMTHYQLKQIDSARKGLADAVGIEEMKLPKEASGYLGEAWPAWVMAEALLREARALIEGPTAEHSVRNTAADTSAAAQSRPQPPAVKPAAPANNGPK